MTSKSTNLKLHMENRKAFLRVATVSNYTWHVETKEMKVKPLRLITPYKSFQRKSDMKGSHSKKPAFKKERSKASKLHSHLMT